MDKGLEELAVDDTLLATLVSRSLRPSLFCATCSLLRGSGNDGGGVGLADEGAVAKPLELTLSVGDVVKGPADMRNDVVIGVGILELGETSALEEAESNVLPFVNPLFSDSVSFLPSLTGKEDALLPMTSLISISGLPLGRLEVVRVLFWTLG